MTNDPAKDPNRRGQIWISPKVQSYMLIHGIIFGAYFLIIFGIAEFFFFEKFKIGLEVSGLPADHELVKYFFDYQWVKVLFIVGCSLIVLLVSTLQMLYVSHRICGPIFKMTKILEELRANPDSSAQIRFREKDFFEELAESANNLFQQYRLVPKEPRDKDPGPA
jgi:hypothetical protein